LSSNLPRKWKGCKTAHTHGPDFVKILPEGPNFKVLKWSGLYSGVSATRYKSKTYSYQSDRLLLGGTQTLPIADWNYCLVLPNNQSQPWSQIGEWFAQYIASKYELGQLRNALISRGITYKINSDE